MTHPEGHHQRTSDLLEKVVADYGEKDSITLGDIKDSLHERGFGVLTVIATLPVSVPFPMPPGYSTIFAVPLVLLSLQMMWGRHSPWLPGWLTRKRIRRATLAMLVQKGNPVLRRIERFLRPRLAAAKPEQWKKIVGTFAFAFTLSVALPIPGTHTLPAWGILLMSLGLISRDGVTILAGIIIGCVGLLVSFAVLYFGAAAAQHIFDRMTSIPL